MTCETFLYVPWNFSN